MPPTLDITSGPPGLEGIHTWDGQFDLNRLISSPRLPRVKVDDITGLRSLPEMDDNREKNTGKLGETVHPSYPRGKTVVYTGRLQAANLAQLRALQTRMLGVFSDSSNEKVMDIVPGPAWGTQPWFFRARTLQCDIDEKQDFGAGAQPTPWQRAFTLGLRLSDPRIFANPPLTWMARASGTHLSVNNQGTAPGDPVIQGWTAGGALTLLNNSVPAASGNAQLYFPTTPVGIVTIDFMHRQINLTVGTKTIDCSGYMDPVKSTWWDEMIPGIKPGVNDVVVTGMANWSLSVNEAVW